ELDTIARKWSGTLSRLPATTTVVVNADDPALAELTRDIPAKRITFGMNERRYVLDHLPHAPDSGACRRCGADLKYTALYVSHLGSWRCPRCTAARPPLDIIGSEIALKDVESLELTVSRRGTEPIRIAAGVPGMYNAYNVLATTAVAAALGVQPPVVQRAMAAFKSAFGRIERVELAGRTITLALVKNPVGFNEVLRMLTMAT